MKRKTPQEKKALSYAKDCRNTYGESDKGSRKSIKQNKAFPTRAFRKNINDILQGAIGAVDLEQSEVIDIKAKGVRRRKWKKYPDTPLGEVVESKVERRESHSGNGKTARKKVREFVANLKIETEQETDGRWIAEAKELNGVIVYGETPEKAAEKCKRLAGYVFLEELGAGKILEINDDYISVETY